MKSKDQIQLEEAYKKVSESTQPNYFEDALANPEGYELIVDTIKTEDYDGNTIYTKIAYLYKAPAIKAKTYERLDNPEGIEDLIAVFTKHNPEGLQINN